MNDKAPIHSENGFDRRHNGWCIRQPTWHFHAKLYERYGIVMEHGEYSEMINDIRSGRAELIERQPGRGAIYAVLLPRCWKRIFVATKGDRVVTALPPTPRLRRKWRRIHGG